MNKKLSISDEGIDHIKKWEGLKLYSYDDGVGIATIGYGTTFIDGNPVVMGMKITKDQAEAYLRIDVSKFEKAVNKHTKSPINQKMFDALVSFVYNVGEANFKKSTLLKKLNEGDYESAAQEFHKWKFAGGKILKGLVLRRASESQLFLDGLSTLEVTQDDCPCDE